MLSKSTEYAIRSLVYIDLKNREQKRPGVLEIAREIEAPEAFTAKILQTLAKQQVIGSMKGRGGGFFFTESSDNFTLFQVISLMEGPAIFQKCGFGLHHCSESNPCPLHEKYQPIRDGFFHLVNTETIQSLTQKVTYGKAVLNRMGV